MTRLKTLLDEPQAATLDKERQLAELEDMCTRRLEEAFVKKLEETEVTFERRRSEEVAAVETECELRRLREAGGGSLTTGLRPQETGVAVRKGGLDSVEGDDMR